MPYFSDVRVVIVLIVAFLIGYGIVNFVIYILRRGREEKTAGGRFGHQDAHSHECRDNADDVGADTHE